MTEHGPDNLIDDEVLAYVGTEMDRSTATVSKKEFQRWAVAVKDRNPLYFDADYAKAHGYRDVVMPPMFLRHLSDELIDLDDTRPDGLPNGFGGSLKLPKTPRRMAGGDTITFLEPVYDGDVITAVRTVESVEQKHGRSGDFVLVTVRVVFTRQDGTVVAVGGVSMLARP